MNLQGQIFSQSGIPAAIQVLVDHYGSQQKILTAIQIGACNGKPEDDLPQRIITGQQHVRAHLVEAVGRLHDDLLQVMEPYSDHVACYNFAIGGRDETRTFYSVSEQFALDQPDAQPWRKYKIGSLTNEHLRLHIPEEYIRADNVQCISPETFLSFAGISPRELNLLITDVEGFDGEIVSAFLEIASPEMIVYEHKVMSIEENVSLLRKLGDRSYAYREFGEDFLCYRVPDEDEKVGTMMECSSIQLEGQIAVDRDRSPLADPCERILITAGSMEPAAYQGDIFLPDQGFSGANTGFTNGNLFYVKWAIQGTEENDLFQHVRYASTYEPALRFRSQMPDGDYNVSLYFAEVWEGARGLGVRVFDISIQKTIVERDLDVFDEVGFATPLVKTYTATVSGGCLTIELRASRNSAMVSGIKIVPVDEAGGPNPASSLSSANSIVR